jgi:cytochrome d ubiquinol oxidase subunit II
LLGGYALLDAGWLIWKTEGSTQAFAREVAHAALIVAALMMAVVSGWTALSDRAVASRWFAWPNIAYLAPLPLTAAIAVCFVCPSLWRRRETLGVGRYHVIHCPERAPPLGRCSEPVGGHGT